MDISYCYAVTDDGIKGLCSDEFGLEIETRSMGQCKLIHTLKMKGTQVTKKGVEMALVNLPKLRTFEFPRSVQILAELRRENLERGNFKTYPLTEFDCDEFEDDSGNSVPYVSGSLRLAANICPSVNVVDIKLRTEVTDIELQGLLELKTLSKLKISGNFPREEEGGQITFDGGVIPLLNASGSFLRLLRLEYLNICVNIRAIAAYCPNLEQLILVRNASYSMALLEEGSLYKEAKFKKLKEFTVFCELSSSFSSKMLSFLLSSPELKGLRVLHCDALTDEVLEKAALIHEFRNLELLRLNSCACVTKKGIDVLMNETNPLRELVVNQCEMIGEQDFEEWQQKAKKENLNIKCYYVRYLPPRVV